jgi:hypothetical protein
MASLGDILGLGGDLGHNIANGNNTLFNVNNNTVSGFESLLIDLTDGKADSVSLDKMLGSLDAMRSAGNDLQSLVFMGDGKDSLNLGGLNVDAAYKGVTINGVDGVFDQYIVYDNKGVELNVYIQQQVMVI